MRIVVNHITRMAPGYMCVAGINTADGTHVRPVLQGRRLSVSSLRRVGGPFDIASIVELGRTKAVGEPPEVEDQLFELRNARRMGALRGDDFWNLLEQTTRPDLESLFGRELKAQGRTCAVDIGDGSASLGCLQPADRPMFRLEYGRLRIELADPRFGRLSLPVTDFRLFNRDQETPRQEIVESINVRISGGIPVILSVGLTRSWQRPDDNQSRHWLQINNIHLQDDPVWQVG